MLDLTHFRWEVKTTSRIEKAGKVKDENNQKNMSPWAFVCVENTKAIGVSHVCVLYVGILEQDTTKIPPLPAP